MIRFGKMIALLAAPPALAAAFPAFAQTAAVTAAAPSIAVDDPPVLVRTASDQSDRITIPIRIGQLGPYDFVIDTGSQRTVISRELASRLALAADQSVRVLSMTGLSDVETVTVPRLSFGSSEMKALQAPVFEGVNLGAPGLLGLDGLKRKRLLLDFERGKMSIAPSAGREKPASDVIVVEARTKLGQLILVDSHADGRKVHVILDTGSQYSIGNAALLRKIARRRPDAVLGQATLTSVTGEQLIGQWGAIKRITMGDIVMTNVPVLFADASPFAQLGLEDKPALLLGIDALRGFRRVAIDFGAKRVDFLLPDQGSIAGSALAALRTPPQP